MLQNRCFHKGLEAIIKCRQKWPAVEACIFSILIPNIVKDGGCPFFVRAISWCMNHIIENAKTIENITPKRFPKASRESNQDGVGTEIRVEQKRASAAGHFCLQYVIACKPL